MSCKRAWNFLLFVFWVTTLSWTLGVILHGRKTMPAFDNRLSPDDLHDLVAYYTKKWRSKAEVAETTENVVTSWKRVSVPIGSRSYVQITSI